LPADVADARRELESLLQFFRALLGQGDVVRVTPYGAMVVISRHSVENGLEGRVARSSMEQAQTPRIFPRRRRRSIAQETTTGRRA
jgi:hypothetical protein